MNTCTMLAPLTSEELDELTDTLWRGWHRAGEVYPITATDTPLPNGGFDYQSHQNPVVYDLEKTYMPVRNEGWARHFGCRWQACLVCSHRSCSFCPTCNPGAVAPNGEAYDDVAD